MQIKQSELWLVSKITQIRYYIPRIVVTHRSLIELTKVKKNILRIDRGGGGGESSRRLTIIAFNGWCESVGEWEGRREAGWGEDDRSLRRLIIIIMARAAERWARIAASWGVRSGPRRVARKRVDGMRFTRLCIGGRRYPWSIPMPRMLAIIAQYAAPATLLYSSPRRWGSSIEFIPFVKHIVFFFFFFFALRDDNVKSSDFFASLHSKILEFLFKNQIRLELILFLFFFFLGLTLGTLWEP